MALIADLTLVHMEALSAIDRIERGLQKLRHSVGEPDQTRRTSDKVAHQSVRLRRQLQEFFERERIELFPRIRRICGPEVTEMHQLVDSQQEVLEALDRFIAGISAEGEAVVERKQLLSAEQHFDEFVERFDKRCSMERSFYQSFSTILFPGGLATD